MRVYRLRAQDLDNPVGLGTLRPVLSYSLSVCENGQSQSAYRILAASSQEILEDNVGDLWDSGKQAWNRNFGIEYGGQELESGQRVFWKVKVWDQKCRESEWSRDAFWEMGLLKEEDWKGYWIGQGDDFQGDKSMAPIFLKDFYTESMGDLVSARLYISGLGVFRARINGENVSEYLYDPGESDAGKSVYYVAYDIGDMVRDGHNSLEVLLGNGQYTGFTINSVMSEGRYQKNDGRVVVPGISGDKKFIAQIICTYQDGTKKMVLVSDEAWKWKESPIVFQNWYGGEDYDGTKEIESSNWKQAAFMEPPGGVLTAREFLPIEIVEERLPKSVCKLENGNWLIDMGQNGAGFPKLCLEGTTEEMSGNWIKMYPAELLNADETGVDQASCTQSWNHRYQCAIVYSYRIKGTGTEQWHPLFSYQGFQYIEMEGFTGELKRENIRCCFVRTGNEKTGSFHSSDRIMNGINELTERSIESNMFGVFTDCPQIEKLGWVETSQLMFRSVASAYDIRSWMRKIIHNIIDSQVDKEQALLPDNEQAGYIPAIVPEYQRIVGLHRDPNWGGACILTSWEYYYYYGDERILEEAYPVMEKYIEYLKGHLKHGVLEDYAQMGEWGQLQEETPAVLVATCSFYLQLCRVTEISRILGKEKERAYYQEFANEIKNSFYAHPLCYHHVSGVYGNGSQASYGCVLYSGLVPEEKKAEVIEQLVEAVKKREYHLSSGEVGLKQVFTSLGEAGRSDIVYQMIMNETQPSYRYFVDCGLTTLPEYWNYDELWQGMVRSRNHAMMGHVKEWFASYVLGIRPMKPAFEEIAIWPFIPKNMKRLSGSLTCSYGEISVSFVKEGKEWKIRTIIPAGIKAVIYKPVIWEEKGEEVCQKEIWKGVGSGMYEWIYVS